MSIGKQLLIALSIYVLSAVIIEGLLWYFNPSLSENIRIAIIASPILISIVLTRVIVERNKTKQDD
jgi:hypothetical protein